MAKKNFSENNKESGIAKKVGSYAGESRAALENKLLEKQQQILTKPNDFSLRKDIKNLVFALQYFYPNPKKEFYDRWYNWRIGLADARKAEDPDTWSTGKVILDGSKEGKGKIVLGPALWESEAKELHFKLNIPPNKKIILISLQTPDEVYRHDTGEQIRSSINNSPMLSRESPPIPSVEFWNNLTLYDHSNLNSKTGREQETLEVVSLLEKAKNEYEKGNIVRFNCWAAKERSPTFTAISIAFIRGESVLKSLYDIHEINKQIKTLDKLKPSLQKLMITTFFRLLIRHPENYRQLLAEKPLTQEFKLWQELNPDDFKTNAERVNQKIQDAKKILPEKTRAFVNCIEKIFPELLPVDLPDSTSSSSLAIKDTSAPPSTVSSQKDTKLDLKADQKE
jgi:hypothetical protein